MTPIPSPSGDRLCSRIEAGDAVLETLPPIAERPARRHKLIQHSRERFATPRTVVEDKLRRWMRANE